MTRITAVIQCVLCDWRARHTADTPMEVAEFLRKVLFEHVEERHAEKKDVLQ